METIAHMNASSLPTTGRLLFDELLLQPNLRLRVGEHIVDIGALRIVTRPDHPRLTSKAAAVLIELVRHAGDTVTRDSLLDRVWADRVTTPDVLTQAIKELRRGFNDDAKPSRFIETIPRVGYRLLAPVSALDGEPFAVDPTKHASAGNDPELVENSLQPAAPSSRRNVRWAWLLTALAAIVVAAVVMLAIRPQPASAPTRANLWTASAVRTVTSDPGSERRPATSPDGTRVAYAQLDPVSGVDRIVLRAIGQSQSVLLTSKPTTFEEVPAWSPDGSQIAFERVATHTCTLFIVPSLGGPEREVGACQDFLTNYFDWAPDGKSLITAENLGGASGSMALVRWDLGSGLKLPVQYARTADDQDLEAHYSPDGSLIAFRRGLAPFSDLCVMPAAGGEVRQLTQLHSRIRGHTWTPDGGGLIFSSNHDGHYALYTVDLRDARVRPLGIGPAEYPNAARNGSGVTYEIPRTTNRLAWVRLGQDSAIPELLAKSTGSDASPALSPAGDRIAFVSDRNGTSQIWVYDFATVAATILTDFHDALLIHPNWSADGKRLLVTVRGNENPGAIEIDLASRRQSAINKPGLDVLSASYAADADSYLLVIGGSSGQQRQNQLVLLEHAGTSEERQRSLASGIEHMEPDPANRIVYYTRNAQHGLFARDFAGGEERQVTPGVLEAKSMDGWRVVDGKIWYVSKADWKPIDIIELDPATGAQRTRAHLDTELQDVNFSVTPARDRIVIAPLGVEDTDIGAFQIGVESTGQR